MLLRHVTAALLTLWLVSCGSENEEKKKQQILPTVAQAVDKARASGMVAGSSAGLNLATDSDAAEALRDFFNDAVSSLGGHTKSGWIDAYLYDLDQRILEVQNDTEPSCLSATPVNVTFDTGVGHSKVLTLSCLRSFEREGDQSGSGSGLAYGRDENNYFIYVMLAQKADPTQKFGYAASINRTTEAVDLLFLDRNPQFNRSKFFSLKTTPEPKSFAFAVAGTGDGPGPISTATTHTLSAGVRFVANETLLLAEGLVGSGTSSTGEVQNSPAEFDATECFDATNLATAPTTCPSSAPTFPSDLPLVLATAMPAVADTVNGALKTMQELVTAGVTVDEGPPPEPTGK